jgi:hypothetical protein
MIAFLTRRVSFVNEKEVQSKEVDEADLLCGQRSTNGESFIVLTVESARLLAAIFRNSRYKPKGRRWNFGDKVLALSPLKCSPKSYIFLRALLPLPCR